MKWKKFEYVLCVKGYEYRRKLKEYLELHEKGEQGPFCDKWEHGFSMEKYVRKHKTRTKCGVRWKRNRLEFVVGRVNSDLNKNSRQ